MALESRWRSRSLSRSRSPGSSSERAFPVSSRLVDLPYDPGMDLREELPDDDESVRDIHLRAFGDHGLVVADLVDALRETITPEDGLSLVAAQDGQVVG